MKETGSYSAKRSLMDVPTAPASQAPTLSIFSSTQNAAMSPNPQPTPGFQAFSDAFTLNRNTVASQQPLMNFSTATGHLINPIKHQNSSKKNVSKQSINVTNLNLEDTSKETMSKHTLQSFDSNHSKTTSKMSQPSEH